MLSQHTGTKAKTANGAMSSRAAPASPARERHLPNTVPTLALSRSALLMRRESAAMPSAPLRPTGRTGWKGVTAKSLGSFVPSLTRKAFETHGFSTATLLTAWTGIVGREWARGTMPERLVWPRTQGSGREGAGPRQGATLVLSVDPTRALETEYRASQILERINIYFGYRAVERLRIQQSPGIAPEAATISAPATPSFTPPPVPEIANIGDPALRDALARLRTSVWRAGQGTR